ncbi:MAG TPA: hypothetical protein VJ851_08780 [Jatrophihabitans sp.]|nr:hypothetical protein [Jatrophihabitans sp.]
MTALRRSAAAVLFASATLLAAASFGAQPAAATALPISQCTTSSGVVLAVDFGHWGGPVLRACGSTPTTGYDLLNQGGWRSTGDRTDGQGFVCRISFTGYQGGAGFPSPAQDACLRTPPSSACWSYWHADPGQSSWTYSEDGAANYHPKPGSVDLWTFGRSGSSPTFSPDAVRAHNSSAGSPSSAPTPHTSAPPAGGSSAPISSHPSTGTSGPAGTSGPKGPADSTAAEATLNHGGHGSSGSGIRPSVGSQTPAATASSTVPAIVDAEPAAAVRHSSGSAVPGLVAAALVLMLAAIAVVVGRRRRQAR